MKLPGYKPKPRPPILPPKERRQRRHSDSVATLTDSGVATTLTEAGHCESGVTPFVEDGPIVQERLSELRPKHNSVSNAIYHEYVIISI